METNPYFSGNPFPRNHFILRLIYVDRPRTNWTPERNTGGRRGGPITAGEFGCGKPGDLENDHRNIKCYVRSF